MLLSALTMMFTLPAATQSPTYVSDLQFLRKYASVVELKLGSERLAVVPAWQGRVMTSAIAPDQPDFGWMNKTFIASKKLVPHMNVFGGEDRFWLGPEGGQYALFFSKGAKFDLAHWQTPPFVDTVPYRVSSKTSSSVTFHEKATVANYSGTRFHVDVTRTVRLLGPSQAALDLGIKLDPGQKFVAYESENTLKNAGAKAWTEKSGLLSIWILGQLHHSPTTTVAIPYVQGPEEQLGVVVNDTYFGKVPADRLVVTDKAIYFKTDGQYRSKIGLNPKRAHNVLGSWDPSSGVLTIIQYTKPAHVTKYVNSMWEIQKKPYGGDCLNSYNDGPPSPGAKPLGPFYEVESSSPAAALAPGDSITHFHRTFHFSGNREALDAISQKVLGVSLNEIESAFSTGGH